jgi:hypothetical protein
MAAILFFLARIELYELYIIFEIALVRDPEGKRQLGRPRSKR